MTFELPAAVAGTEVKWRRVLDTALASPDDICDAETGVALGNEHHYRVEPHSVVLLIA